MWHDVACFWIYFQVDSFYFPNYSPFLYLRDSQFTTFCVLSCTAVRLMTQSSWIVWTAVLTPPPRLFSEPQHTDGYCAIKDKSSKSQQESYLFHTHTKAREPHHPTPPAIHKSSPYTRPPARRIISFKCTDGMEERSSTALTVVLTLQLSSSGSPKLSPLSVTFTDLLTAVKLSCWPDLCQCILVRPHSEWQRCK